MSKEVKIDMSMVKRYLWEKDIDSRSHFICLVELQYILIWLCGFWNQSGVHGMIVVLVGHLYLYLWDLIIRKFIPNLIEIWVPKVNYFSFNKTIKNVVSIIDIKRIERFWTSLSKQSQTRCIIVLFNSDINNTIVFYPF